MNLYTGLILKPFHGDIYLLATQNTSHFLSTGIKSKSSILMTWFNVKITFDYVENFEFILITEYIIQTFVVYRNSLSFGLENVIIIL